MTDFSVDFLGCKISQTDAETIRDALALAGHSERDAASVHVVNTCCITAEAEKKSRKRVRQLLRSDGSLRVFVTGCGASLREAAYGDIDDRVVTLPGAAPLVAHRIVEAVDGLGRLACRGVEPTAVSAARRRTRAFVKVQDGCSFPCSYCIVPTVRGTSRSRPAEAVLAEVARRAAAGQREIVLTGVNIGLYREPEARFGLPRLLHEVADVPGVARVRISSIEVNHVNRRLVEAIAAHPKVCPHLHVPLQSGDDGVLAAMRRNYDSTRYLRAIAHARASIPHLNLTTDVIVGFPAEDDAAFERTLAVAREAGFTKVHAFPFSPRPGTDAEAVDAADPVPAEVKRARSQRLRAEADERARAHRAALAGRYDEVIVEAAGGHGEATLTDGSGKDGGDAAGTTALRGYTRDYSPVVLAPSGNPASDGDHVRVQLERADGDVLIARVLGPASRPA